MYVIIEGFNSNNHHFTKLDFNCVVLYCFSRSVQNTIFVFWFINKTINSCPGNVT